jgi:hypothetical protein
MGKNPLLKDWCSYCSNDTKKMKLFNTKNTLHAVNLNILSYSTPFGNINFDFIFNGNQISNTKPKKIELTRKTIIASWNFNECYVEFLRTDFIPKLPSKMKVESCVAGIWRIKSFCDGLIPTFKVYLEKEVSSEIDEFSETGEGLIAQTFENNIIKLSIGTEDEYYLSERARIQKWMPSRFLSILEENAIEYIPSGIQINLPKMELNECAQIQNVIAWCLKENSEESNWFAVDQSSDYILKSIDVT